MLCPVCRHDNFEGEDTCANCGADLRTADIPQPALEFHDTVLGDHLHALGFTAPHSVDPTTGRRRCDPPDARGGHGLPARL